MPEKRKITLEVGPTCEECRYYGSLQVGQGTISRCSLMPKKSWSSWPDTFRQRGGKPPPVGPQPGDRPRECEDAEKS
jgi:hypothetical protein